MKKISLAMLIAIFVLCSCGTSNTTSPVGTSISTTVPTLTKTPDNTPTHPPTAEPTDIPPTPSPTETLLSVSAEAKEAQDDFIIKMEEGISESENSELPTYPGVFNIAQRENKPLIDAFMKWVAALSSGDAKDVLAGISDGVFDLYYGGTGWRLGDSILPKGEFIEISPELVNRLGDYVLVFVYEEGYGFMPGYYSVVTVGNGWNSNGVTEFSQMESTKLSANTTRMSTNYLTRVMLIDTKKIPNLNDFVEGRKLENLPFVVLYSYVLEHQVLGVRNGVAITSVSFGN